MFRADVFLYCLSLVLYGFINGMLVSRLMTMRRQRRAERILRQEAQANDTPACRGSLARLARWSQKLQPPPSTGAIDHPSRPPVPL